MPCTASAPVLPCTSPPCSSSSPQNSSTRRRGRPRSPGAQRRPQRRQRRAATSSRPRLQPRTRRTRPRRPPSARRTSRPFSPHTSSGAASHSSSSSTAPPPPAPLPSWTTPLSVHCFPREPSSPRGRRAQNTEKRSAGSGRLRPKRPQSHRLRALRQARLLLCRLRLRSPRPPCGKKRGGRQQLRTRALPCPRWRQASQWTTPLVLGCAAGRLRVAAVAGPAGVWAMLCGRMSRSRTPELQSPPIRTPDPALPIQYITICEMHSRVRLRTALGGAG